MKAMGSCNWLNVSVNWMYYTQSYRQQKTSSPLELTETSIEISIFLSILIQMI